MCDLCVSDGFSWCGKETQGAAQAAASVLFNSPSVFSYNEKKGKVSLAEKNKLSFSPVIIMAF